MNKEDINARLFGRSLFGQSTRQQMPCILGERFLFPPFSVLNAQKGEWQKRKQAWLRLGIESELGRDAITYSLPQSFIQRLTSQTIPEELKKYKISIFDPVLCEFIYLWFCPKNGWIIDPFAGGSVRGVVAGCLERKYWGCDLSKEQIEANKKQAIDIKPNIMPEWIYGDSMVMLENAPDADLIFTCPPYGNLEKYSDDPHDLSSMNWPTFCEAYRKIITKSVQKLKQNRFACFVVSNFRGLDGYYHDLVGETIRGFSDCQCSLYNDCILITILCSAPQRTKQFETNRKMVKVHQNILIFCKGDWKKAAEATKNE